jgi:hypothetical protein
MRIKAGLVVALLIAAITSAGQLQVVAAQAT